MASTSEEEEEPLGTRQLLFVVMLCATQAFLVCNYALAVTFLNIQMSADGMSSYVVATIFSSFELGKLFTSLFGAMLTARFGRYTLLIVGVLFSSAFSAFFGIVPDLTGKRVAVMAALLVASRLLLGCGVALAQQSIYAILSDSFPKSRGLVVGSANSMVAIGYMVGPAVGGALYSLGGFRLPFLVVGTLVGLCVPPIIVLYPRATDASPVLAAPAAHNATSQGLRVYLRQAGALPVDVWIVALIDAIYMAKWAWWDVWITEWCVSEFHLSILQASLCVTLLAGLFGVLTPPSGIIGDRLGNQRILLIIWGVTLLTALYIFVGPWQLQWSITVRWPLFVLYLVLDGLFCVPVESHLLPTMLGLAEASVGAREQQLTDLVVALYKTAMNFGRVVGPYAAVPIVEAIGVRGAFAVWAIPFAFMAMWAWLLFASRSCRARTIASDGLAESLIRGSDAFRHE